MRTRAPEDVREAVGGRWLQTPPAAPIVLGAGIDSRRDLRGRVYFAIRGDRHDGHAFLDAAVASGACLLVVEENAAEHLPSDVGVIAVDDTRKALGRLARDERRGWRDKTVIAITGTAGKTTTKRLLHGVLSTRLPGTAARRSFNNDIGVPLTLLSARDEDDYVVVEIGTNAPGEVAELAAMTEPDVAVITLIGHGHLEGLGTLAGVASEKLSLLRHVRPGGLAVLHADSVPSPKSLGDRTIVTYGRDEEADLVLRGHGRDQGRWWFEVEPGGRFKLCLPGAHNATNALAVLAVARRLGLSDRDVRRGLEAVEPADMRLRPVRIDGITIYNDAYNANPESMKASIATFLDMARSEPHRTVVLGDMLELGEHAPGFHQDLGRTLLEADRACRIDRVVLVGALMQHAASMLETAWNDDRVRSHPELTAEAAAAIRRDFPEDGAVLLKGSRGIGLERVLTTDVLQPAPSD